MDVCVKGSRNSATLVTSISSPHFPSQDHLLGDLLAIAGQPQEAHEVNEGCGWVEAPAKLTGGVIIGEGVVVVVEAFS